VVVRISLQAAWLYARIYIRVVTQGSDAVDMVSMLPNMS
jgi:hypothetical protein